MKVMIVASRGRSLLNFRGALIDSMLARGVEVHTVQPERENGPDVSPELLRREVIVHKVPMQRTGTNVLADMRLLLALRGVVRAERPDVLLAYTIKPVIYGILAAWLCRVPSRCALITGLGYAFAGSNRGRLGNLVPWLYSLALKRAHLVFFQNPDDQLLFRTRGILPDSVRSVVVNGSGVDLEVFGRRQVPAGPVEFLLIARLLESKGVREYAEAARRVRKEHPETRFKLVGWIDDAPDAIEKSELDAWIAAGDIEYLGRLEDVRDVLAQCSVFVLPSYREGTPRTVLEAMAVGRAIITTDAPGCRETVEDGVNGFLVPVKSVEGLVDAILCFLRSPELAISFGERSRQIAQMKYDVHVVNEMMMREIGLSDRLATKTGIPAEPAAQER